MRHRAGLVNHKHVCFPWFHLSPEQKTVSVGQDQEVEKSEFVPFPRSRWKHCQRPRWEIIWWHSRVPGSPHGEEKGSGTGDREGPGVLLQQEQGSPFPQAPSWAGHLGTGPAKVLCEGKLPAVLWFRPSLSEAKRLKVSFWCKTSNMKQLCVAKRDGFCSLRSHSSKCRAWGCFLQLSEIVIFFIYCCFLNAFQEKTLETKSWLVKF